MTPTRPVHRIAEGEPDAAFTNAALLDYADRYRRVVGNEVQWRIACASSGGAPTLTLRELLCMVILTERGFKEADRKAASDKLNPTAFV